MSSPSKFRTHIGIIALLLGGLLIGSGLYQPMTCTSGRGILVSEVGPNESINPDQSVPFVELSMEEQQAFLSALTDENNQSRIDADGSQPQFANVRYVSYKGADYEVHSFVTDCFSTPLSSLTLSGLVVAVLGVGILHRAGFWRGIWDNLIG